MSEDIQQALNTVAIAVQKFKGGWEQHVAIRTAFEKIARELSPKPEVPADKADTTEPTA